MADDEMNMTVHKTFNDYYSEPNYRRKHLDYVLTKVECKACKTMVARCNMTKHKKTMKHKRNQDLVDEKALKNGIDEVKLKELFDWSVKRYLENKKYLPNY